MAKDFLDIIKTRRSVRKFNDEPVSRKDIEAILDCARFAPSASNSQPWRFLVTKDGELIEETARVLEDKINEIAGRMKSAGAQRNFRNYAQYFTFYRVAPVIIAFYWAPTDTLLTRLLDRYAPEYGEVAGREWGAVSVAAAVQNVLLAAHSLGYGATWLTAPLFAREEMERLLGADESWELMGFVALGHPDGELSVKLPERKGLDEITDWE
ncbi:MAG: nitroreductase family protein [bacterium]|nr:nitroreductase family protein [bacterium]